ncbi:MAG: dihydropteroate synthase [Spirochaetaceae bacterium]|nr:dihydropteroate synthase [Spirochaetaceae bacterium]
MNDTFIVIGENIHTTRVLRRKGSRISDLPGGSQAVNYRTKSGEVRYLPIPEAIRTTQDFEEGRVKHVQIAVREAMAGSAGAAEGLRYLHRLAQRQEDAGAHFLDLNVDEISLRLEDQQEAIGWLVRTIRRASRLPLSIDSSNIDIIRAGLEAWSEGADGARGLLNSASLERLEALDLAREFDVQVIVTAAGESGMPTDTAERVANASRVVDAALQRGIPAADIYVDPLVFPIAVDQEFGNHCLAAIRELRERYGAELHITGGFSNVSFGMPQRRLINDVFLRLAIDAGADSGILDPVTSHIDSVLGIDRGSRRYRMAADLLLGRDQYCASFIRAHRKGELVSDG